MDTFERNPLGSPVMTQGPHRREHPGLAGRRPDRRPASRADHLYLSSFFGQMTEMEEDLRARLAECEGKAEPSSEDLIQREHLRLAYRVLREENLRCRSLCA